MVKQDFFKDIFERLINGNQKWQLVPNDVNLNFLEAEYNSITELYFTNNEKGSWSQIAAKDVQRTTFLVGQYMTRYYYDEDQYTLETNYFFGVAKRIASEIIEPEYCLTVSDSSFEPIYIDREYTVIRDLFNKAKKSTFNFEDILSDLDL